MSDEQDLGLVANGKDPASGEPDLDAPWLGHRDLCSVQWSDICDCDPNNPIDFSDPNEETKG